MTELEVQGIWELVALFRVPSFAVKLIGPFLCLLALPDTS